MVFAIRHVEQGGTAESKNSDGGFAELSYHGWYSSSAVAVLTQGLKEGDVARNLA